MAQVPVKQTARLTKLSVPTIRHWFAVFRPKLPDDTDTLDSLVQLDEAYFGSKSKNTLRALFMGKQMDSRKLAYKIINKPYPVREDAWDFLKEKVKPQTQIATDGAKIYRGMDKWWPVTHSYDLHRKFEFEQTSEIEGIFDRLVKLLESVDRSNLTESRKSQDLARLDRGAIDEIKVIKYKVITIARQRKAANDNFILRQQQYRKAA